MSKKYIQIKDPESSDLIATSFYGGHERGKCMQITIDGDYTTLERKEVEELRDALSEWLDN